MIDFLKEDINGIILDMDGVLWKDSEPIGNLAAIFKRFEELKLPVILATNNATRTIKEYKQKLLSMGVDLADWQIATSGQAVIYHLSQKYLPQSKVYVVGMDSLKSMIVEAGYVLDDKNAVAVVVGVDRHINFEKITVASRLIRAGAEFIGTNPDKTFPTPGGLIPGAGAIIAAVEAAAETEPIFVGKPGKILMEMALSRLNGISSEHVLMVGDRLETDIAAAQSCGCRSALVLSGVTKRELAEKWNPKPDYIFNDLSELVGV
jgi:4-nitrophenyl phosphatase